MIRRGLSFGLLVAALVALILDALESPTRGTTLTVTSIGDLWARTHPASLEFAGEVPHRILPWLAWDVWFSALVDRT